MIMITWQRIKNTKQAQYKIIYKILNFSESQYFNVLIMITCCKKYIKKNSIEKIN